MVQAAIPHVELGVELGRGAHSVVLQGVRGGRSYAVKLPLEADSSAEREMAFRRFLREAAALARLHHPSLPAVMEVGRADGVPYLIMELAAGQTLADRLELSSMGEEAVTQLALQLAGALEAIHAAGLLHRDVKPRNIVFDVETGVARLIDFGSAVLASGPAMTGITRAYAAPEVLAGGPDVSDARADLYSLGQVLLEALSGPMLGGTRSPWPSARPANQQGPLSLANILGRLVEVEPADRYSSASRLRQDLETLAGEQSASRSVPTRQKLLGRAKELDRLRRAWAEAQRGGRVVVLRGAPGAGKTRLAQAFLRDSTEQGVRVLSAGCHPRDPRAFSAIRQLVEAYLRSCEALPAADRARAFSGVRRIAGDLGSLLRLLSPYVARVFRDAPMVPASENAEQAFAEGLAEFLMKLVRTTGPTVVFVDDVQWLDAGSRRVLVRAANQVANRGVLFLFGARDGEATRDVNRLLDVLSAPVSDIELLPLEDDDVVSLVHEYLGTAAIDDELKRAVLRLSDGLPFRTLEVLRTLTDEGVLLPYWGRWRLDPTALTRMHLPSETATILRRRIAALDGVTHSVMAAAAVIGVSFEEWLLVSVASSSRGVADVSAALAEARRSQLIEDAGEGVQRFIHHTVREALLAGCDAAALEDLHQRVGETLDARGWAANAPIAFEIEERADAATPASAEPLPDRDSLDADRLYRVAHHYAAGDERRAVSRRAETCVAAARAAFARFDNERAADFFTVADRALTSLGKSLTPETRLLLADARLRAGALEEASSEFQRILSESSDRYVQATALLRLASLHDMRFDSIQAWNHIEQAFCRLGETPPSEAAAYAVQSLGAWGRRGLAWSAKVPFGPSERLHHETLCALYYQATRIAVTNGKPLRGVLVTLQSVRAAERLGPSAALARCYLAYSFVLTVLGFPSRGTSYLARAEGIARELRDPFVYSHALQMHMVIAAWGGRIQDAIDAGARCVTEYGHWRELSEFCINCYTVYQMESVRGRELEAWRWADLAIQRVNNHDGAPVVHEFLLLGAKAALCALGREDEIDSRLQRLAQVTVAVPPDSGSFASTFSGRIRMHTEKADLGEAFESLVSDFQALGQDPRRVHMNVTEYYVHVAHARVHACLRARPEARSKPLAELGAALGDLRAAAKIPLISAHARVVEGYHEWLSGHSNAAQRAFEEAERLAVSETAPWVLYAVYRGRAHLLQAEGKVDAARDQAVLAESVASEHGAAHRARWIREEFGGRARRGSDGSDITGSLSLPSPDLTDMVAPAGASRARRQLRALLRISQARAQDLTPDHQARLVVDELILALRAQRGFLLLRAGMAGAAGVDGSEDRTRSDPPLRLVAGRDSAGRNLDGPEDYDRNAVRGALFASVADSEDPASLRFRVATSARLTAIAAPLIVDDLTAGVICLDRPLTEGVFSEADGALLTALAAQVAVALELTRALRARERAQESLRNAEKMDAVARLGRAIAHDLNNMLSAIRLATMAIVALPGASSMIGDDVHTIQSALQRANELTKQLGTFSRGEFAKPGLVKVGPRIDRLLPVIAGLVGESIRIRAEVAPRTSPIMIDPDQLDHVLMNLVVNSRDAMPDGGEILIAVAEVRLDEAYVTEHPRVVAGRYIRISLTDTGHGMDEEVRGKIFEPYFTTKRERGGTGLGLASVYWAVSASGGHVDVRSGVGTGTTFTLHFPVAGKGVPGARSEPRAVDRPTLLVVEAGRPETQHVERTLAELGYRVRVASSAADAIEMVRQSNDIALVITDVVMVGMNGLELARRIRGAREDVEVLLTSGDRSGVLAERGILGEEVEILQRPVAPEILARRVREILARQQTE